MDRAVDFSTSGLNETVAIIDRFPIDLVLEPSLNFTARKRFSGIYNLTTFDISFRMECSENYFGLDCTQNYSDMDAVNRSNGTGSDDVAINCEGGESCNDHDLSVRRHKVNV